MVFCNLGGDGVYSLCRAGVYVVVYSRLYIQSIGLNYEHIQTLISSIRGNSSDWCRRKNPRRA